MNKIKMICSLSMVKQKVKSIVAKFRKFKINLRAKSSPNWEIMPINFKLLTKEINKKRKRLMRKNKKNKRIKSSNNNNSNRLNNKREDQINKEINRNNRTNLLLLLHPRIKSQIIEI